MDLFGSKLEVVPEHLLAQNLSEETALIIELINTCKEDEDKSRVDLCFDHFLKIFTKAREFGQHNGSIASVVLSGLYLFLCKHLD